MNKRGRKKIYKRIVQSSTGIWVKGDGLSCQEKLRAEWDKLLQGY